MDIQKAQINEIEVILSIYAFARKFMAENGNPDQWKNTYPTTATLINDINNQNLYVIKENNEIHAVFAFIIGKDETYTYINGKWLSDDEYGTIHRVASDGQIHKVLDTIIDFCTQKISHLRIDTHHDNTIMQHLIEKNNFKKCGIIYLSDNSPRIAYEKI
ncbi:MAG: N-acetyltransferase [Erysipelotrichia bacterium]|nr:N-acetyltransferase [Erysipelotrichia bacterium]